VRTGKWFANGVFTVVLLMAGGLAFGNGYIKDSSLLDKIQVGVTTSKQVTEILGPPASVSNYPRRGIDDWNYTMREEFSKYPVGITISIDGGGIVRNVQRLVRYGP